MRRTITKCLAVLVAWACAELNGADWPAASRGGPAGLPTRVVGRTREQLRNYLGQTELKGIPLLDPAINWDIQSNWPNRFVYQGHWYELEITQLSDDGPKPVRVRGFVNPGMTVLFDYRPITGKTSPGLTNGIYPRASWSPRHRVPYKLLFWGSTEFGGTRKTVFDYEFYPEGGLYEFYWQPVATDKGQWEVFDRSGKLVGLMTSDSWHWNGAKVSRTQFQTLSTNLKRSGGSTSQTPVQPGAPPNTAAPRR